MIAWFKKLPQMMQLAVIAVILVILVYAGTQLKKYLEKLKSSKGSREEVEANQNRLELLAEQGVVPTMSSAEATSKANAALTAADGCDALGQGAQVIMQIIYSLQNEADYRLLIEKFGVRTWDECGYFTGDVTGSFTTLMISELDSGQLAEARRHLGQFNVSF